MPLNYCPRCDKDKELETHFTEDKEGVLCNECYLDKLTSEADAVYDRMRDSE